MFSSFRMRLSIATVALAALLTVAAPAGAQSVVSTPSPKTLYKTGPTGRYLMDEYRRGACGTMPACEMTDVHAQVWNALDSGDLTRAAAESFIGWPTKLMLGRRNFIVQG